MSIKIYDGFRLPAGVGLEDLPAWGARVRACLAPLRSQALDRSIFLVAASNLDQHLLASAGLRQPLPDEYPLPWKEVEDHWSRRLEDLRHQRRAPDLDVEVQGWATARHDRNKLYLRLSAEMPDLKKEAIAAGGLREFGYWNNTDEPDGMGEQRFARRGLIWKTLLGAGRGPRHPASVDCTVKLCAPPTESDLRNSQLRTPGATAPMEWQRDFDRRTMDACISSIPSSELPEEVRQGLEKGGFSAYMKYDRHLRSGQDEVFNQRLDSARACLPRVVDPRWFSLDRAALAALVTSPTPPRRPTP